MHDRWYRGDMVLSKNTVKTSRTSADQQEHRSDIATIEAKRVSDELDCSSNLDDILRTRQMSTSPSTLKVSTASIDVILPEAEFDPSLEILRSFSSDSMQNIRKSQSADPDFDRGIRSASVTLPVEAAPIPRRNLAETFEELCIRPSKSWATGSPEEKVSKNVPGKSNMISPTGVTELQNTAVGTSGESAIATETSDPCSLITPVKNDRPSEIEKSTERDRMKLFQFRLHPQLQRDMSDALIKRVCFYSIIHDINKEAASMASNDDSGYNQNPEVNEQFDPLILAANGRPRQVYTGSSSVIKTALIDEEQWLLDAIDSRTSDEARSIKACPPTFLQAMGERDYENPLTSLSNGSRTQLWKPSRSWWEAKSGKNPWIEPTSHNKRWRYLWPLIHYHKFLAKCIKKLKRNGICVKSAISPVSVYLREEVCAVSDHLASVSLFNSDEWMACLKNFDGWMESSEEAEKHSREIVSTLKLRSLHEPNEVDSTLLRSQIDEQYLRVMVNARAQMTGNNITKSVKETTKEPMKRRERNNTGSVKSSLSISSVDAEAPRHRHTSTHNSKGRSAFSGQLRNWQGYNPHQCWWQNSWQQHHSSYPYGDDASVHSSLSCDTSYSHGYMNNYNHSAVPPHSQYYSSMMYTQHHGLHRGPHGAYSSSTLPPNNSIYPGDVYDPQHMDPAGWMRHPSMGNYHSTESSEIPGTPGAHVEEQDYSVIVEQDAAEIPEISESQNPDESFDTQGTPYKPSPNHVPMSPYWGHLQDHATLAMMGLSSPPGSIPHTPHRNGDSVVNQEDLAAVDTKNNLNAQPLLLRQQYYGYGYGSREGYAPPSPATQFMMSPQASFAYNYGYGCSPSRPSVSQTRLLNTSISEEEIDVLHGMPEGMNSISEATKSPTISNKDLKGETETDDA